MVINLWEFLAFLLCIRLEIVNNQRIVNQCCHGAGGAFRGGEHRDPVLLKFLNIQLGMALKGVSEQRFLMFGHQFGYRLYAGE